MKKDFKEYKLKAKIKWQESHTWMCETRGAGELESVNQGRFKRFQFRAGDGNQKFVPVKDWPSTQFAVKSAGRTTLSDSSSLLFFYCKEGFSCG